MFRTRSHTQINITRNPITAIRRAIPGLLFIVPGFAGFILFYLWPFVISVGYSFLNRPVGGEFVGFQNYLDLFSNPAYRLGLRNTIIFIGLSVPINIALSLWVAMMINKTTKYKPLFILIFLIPLVIPSGSMVFFWRQMFAFDGFLNGLLYNVGLDSINWLNSNYARLTLLIIFVWKNLGFNMVLFIAGLSNIPREYYEAAHIDGAGSFTILKRITLPCLIPTFILTFLMSIINSFRVFREVYLLMGSHPHESVYMLQHFMNNNFFALNYPRLSTATTLLAIALTILTLFFFKLERKVLHD